MEAIDKANSLGYLTNLIARQFAHLIGERLAPLGITPAYLPVLFELWGDRALAQSELTELSAVSQATMANTLNRMERDGLIVRVMNPNDGRSRLIALSDKAKSLEAQIKKIAQSVNDGVLSALTDDETRQWLVIMEKVVDKQKQMMR